MAVPSALFEEGCARLCLLTRAAWQDGLPAPLSRPAVRRLLASGALRSLVLRDASDADERLCEQARLLLARSEAVAKLLEAYKAQGYRLLLPGEAAWPARLAALGAQAPLFLFVRGNAGLLARRAIAVAGSREIAPDTRALAQRTGRMLAQEGFALVTGGARGVDQAAQRALLEAGGRLILVPAVTGAEAVRGAQEKKALESGRLLIACDTLPDEPFSAQKALGRNHTIYALGEAALVLAARRGTGGSWRGATDCLRGGYAPVYAPDGDGADFAGNRALYPLGARPIDLSGETPIASQLAGRTEQLALL